MLATYGLWIIQTVAIVVAGAGIILTIWIRQRIARRRATLDLIMMEQSHPSMIETRREFIKLKDGGHLVPWAAPDKTASPEATVIRGMLNRYELLAIGVREGTLDERIYKRWYRTTVVDDWIACKPLVMQLRHNLKTSVFFCEYEELVKMWATPEEKKRI